MSWRPWLNPNYLLLLKMTCNKPKARSHEWLVVWLVGWHSVAQAIGCSVSWKQQEMMRPTNRSCEWAFICNRPKYFLLHAGGVCIHCYKFVSIVTSLLSLHLLDVLKLVHLTCLFSLLLLSPFLPAARLLGRLLGSLFIGQSQQQSEHSGRTPNQKQPFCSHINAVDVDSDLHVKMNKWH